MAAPIIALFGIAFGICALAYGSLSLAERWSKRHRAQGNLFKHRNI